MANYPWASSSVFEYRTPCCECPVDCGEFNITTGLSPFYDPDIPGTEEAALAALAEYGVSCTFFTYPITTDYAYSSRSYTIGTNTITMAGGVDSVVDANSALFVGSVLLSLQAGTLRITGSYSSYCTAGVNTSSSLDVFIVGPSGFSESYSTTGSLGEDVVIPESGCYTVTVQASTQCECPAPTPLDPPPECNQTAGVSLSVTLEMDGMIASPLSIDWADNTTICE